MLKNIILTILLLMLPLHISIVHAQSQHNFEFYNNNCLVTVTNGAELHVLGDAHMRGSSAMMENNGYIKIQGDFYADNLFQQRGVGTVRFENNLVNQSESQKISGSAAVRSVSSSSIGVNDGSFFNLELANSTGIVWLETNAIAGSTKYVADVRNSVNFLANGSVVNRIITHNPTTIPANGNSYSAVFGVLNANTGLGSMINNTITTNSEMSGVDNGYVQGVVRRRINTAGGIYGFPVGLEPAANTAQRGVQYMLMNINANNYDILEAYFQTMLPNDNVSQMECSGNTIDYWGGIHHGQWVITNPTMGAGNYAVQVWCQDNNFPSKDTWVITKDNNITGTADECGSSPIGLTRSGFTIIGASSTFGVAASSTLVTPLSSELLKIWIEEKSNSLEVDWKIGSEFNVSHYVLQRSIDGVNFLDLTVIQAVGYTTTAVNYGFNDMNVNRNQDYYYRYIVYDFDGVSKESPIVSGRINAQGINNQIGTVSFYPNPSIDIVNLDVNTGKAKSIEIRIFNSIGQTVKITDFQLEKGQNIIPFDTQSWAEGVYTFFITEKETKEQLIMKIVKQ